MFPCTKCGACCRKADRLPDALKQHLSINEDGSCGFLLDDGMCSIYEDRPLFCRIEDIVPKSMGLKEWHKLNASMCNALQEEAGMDESFMVVIEGEE